MIEEKDNRENNRWISYYDLNYVFEKFLNYKGAAEKKWNKREHIELNKKVNK